MEETALKAELKQHIIKYLNLLDIKPEDIADAEPLFGENLGLDSIVRKLSLRGKKVAFALSNLLMLGCCVLMFYGTLKQHGINASTRSAVTEIRMSWVYGVGYITSVAMGLMILGKLVQLAKGQFQESDLIQVQDSEEVVIAHTLETKN